MQMTALVEILHGKSQLRIHLEMGRKYEVQASTRHLPFFNFFLLSVSPSLEGRRKRALLGEEESGVCWNVMLPRATLSIMAGSKQTEGRHTKVLFASGQVLVNLYLLSLAPPVIAKGQRLEEVLWNVSFGYFSSVIPSEETCVGSREAGGGNLWEGSCSCSPRVPLLWRVQSGAITFHPLVY